MSIDGACELCGATTPCEFCRRHRRQPERSRLFAALVDGAIERRHQRVLAHAVSGKPAAVVEEWERLAREDECPS